MDPTLKYYMHMSREKQITVTKMWPTKRHYRLLAENVLKTNEDRNREKKENLERNWNLWNESQGFKQLSLKQLEYSRKIISSLRL